MKRRDFLKYIGVSAPYQQWLLGQLLAVEGGLLLAPYLSFPSLAAAQEGAIPVTELKHWSTPDYTRVSIALEKEAKFELHKLPSRLYLDIAGARINRGIKDLSIGDGLLKSVRIAQHNATTVRVVLDLDSIKDYKVFTFADPFR